MGQGQSSGKFNGTEGYHVLKVVADSPADKAGLRAYFDYILAVNETRLDQESNALVDTLLEMVDKPVTFSVYSAKTQEVRQIVVTPSKTWSDNSMNGLIGAVVRFCNFDQADHHCWRILSVQENSPTWQAGLVPDADYILGSADALLKDRDDFFHLVEAFTDKPLRLFVYNSVFDSCREVQIVPRRGWGGDGLLGCSLGYGYLHRLSNRPANAVQGQITQEALKGKIEDHSHVHGHEGHSHEAGHSHDHSHQHHSHHDHSHSHPHDHAHDHAHNHAHDHHSHHDHTHHQPAASEAPTQEALEPLSESTAPQTAQTEQAVPETKPLAPEKTENESIL